MNKRDQLVQVKFTVEEKQQIRRAATIQGQDISEFVRAVVLPQVKQVLKIA